MSTYTITDQVSGIVYAGIDRYDIATTLKGLDPDAPAEVLAVCESLESKLHRGDYYGDDEAFLQVEVTR